MNADSCKFYKFQFCALAIMCNTYLQVLELCKQWYQCLHQCAKSECPVYSTQRRDHCWHTDAALHPVHECCTSSVTDTIKLCPREAQTCTLPLFCICDLEINPMTLKRHDLDILKMYLHTENEAASLRHSKT